MKILRTQQNAGSILNIKSQIFCRISQIKKLWFPSYYARARQIHSKNKCYTK